ncbi:MAG: hypothetical protein ACKOXM_04795, partial [Agromyces sp.]
MKRFGIVSAIGLVALLLLKLVPQSALAMLGGLPGHPLVVHAAVVLLPLAAVALAVLVWRPKRSAVAEWLTLVCLWVGSAAAIFAET